MRKTILRVVLPLLLILAVFASASQADDMGPLTSLMEVFNVTKGDDGKEKLVKTERILPGQTVQYVLTHSNVSDASLKNLNILGPIPETCIYVAASATQTKEATPLFSIDKGVKYSPEPVMYTVKLANGKEEERVATPDMYTHVKWEISKLDPKKTTVQRYRVTIK